MQTASSRDPAVFVIPAEAHLELIKVRDHLRLMTRFVEPGSVAMHERHISPERL